jgi:hypothetical protein
VFLDSEPSVEIKMTRHGKIGLCQDTNDRKRDDSVRVLRLNQSAETALAKDCLHALVRARCYLGSAYLPFEGLTISGCGE